MSGFQHDIAGGGGDLVAVSVQSPNFVHGVSGWQIARDGSAEFQDVILPAGTGLTATFAATAPASPATGDLWYNTSAGLEVSQWDGSAWVAYQIGTGAIASGAITASRLAAGIVYAGIVNATTINAATFTGSTFEGTDFIINTSGAFFYSGTPASGNLIESVSNTAGTDGFSNHYVAGHATYQSGFAASLNGGFQVFYTGSLSAGWTASVTIEIDSSGNLYLAAAGGGTLEMDQSGNVTISGALSVSGTFSAGGETGYGGPGGTVTGGPNSGTFAGHTHDFLGHYHTY